MNMISKLWLGLLLGYLFTLGACRGQTPPSKKQVPMQKTMVPRFKDALFTYKGQLCQHLRKIYQDRAGNLWFGTNVYGLMQYNGDSLRYFNEQHGLGRGRITGITEDAKGKLWIATSEGLSRFDGDSFTSFIQKDNPAKNEIWSMWLDEQGVFWLGTMKGVSTFDGEAFYDFPLPALSIKDTNTILGYERITSILQDHQGTFWFGTDGFGICQYDGKAFKQLTTEDGLCDNTISELYQDRQGTIWIGTMFGGLSSYDGTTFHNPTAEGLITGEEVGGFYEDSQGNLWFAAENHGVYTYQAAKGFTNLYRAQGLLTNGILSIYEDREKRFWFGGWMGLFRYQDGRFSTVTKEGPWN